MNRSLKKKNRSFGEKYNFSVRVVLAIMLICEAMNLICTAFVITKYDRNHRSLELINSVYQSVGKSEQTLDRYYTFLREEYYEYFLEEEQEVRRSLKNLPGIVDTRYSRQIVDFYYATESYIERATEFAQQILAYENGDSGKRDIHLLEEQKTKLQTDYQTTAELYNQACAEQMEYIKSDGYQVKHIWYLILVSQFLIIVVGVRFSMIVHNKVKNEALLSLKKLTDFAENITVTGVLPDTGVVLNTEDEFAVLAQAFDEMLEENRRQMAQIEENARVKQQLQQAEMENMKISNDLKNNQYKLLESRINPHFLFNTLNMILQIAYIENAKQTSKLIEATSDFLRYNLNRLSKIGTIEDEIRNIKDYTYIQECRFGNRIQFLYEIDDTLYSYHMPCMILQPLVENAIIHGIGHMLSQATISIRLYSRESWIYLDVEDNGQGIEAEQLKMINEQMRMKVGYNDHIGLQNVNMRLKLYFGDGVKFTVDSKAGKTICSIKMKKE